LWARLVSVGVTTSPLDTASPVVRKAVRADLLAVFRIEQASFPQPWSYSAFERYLGEDGFLVAEAVADIEGVSGEAPADGGTIVGYVVADTVPNHDRMLGHVKDIAVAEPHRGEGIGRTLIQRALTVLAEQGAESVKLEVREDNDRAISLYRSFGFRHRRTVPRYYDNGEDALIMVRN
jgi:ribosomal-protein-alanine N-acetyltransferase